MRALFGKSVGLRACGWCGVLLLAAAGLLAAGCEADQKAVTLEQKIARQVNPVREQLVEFDESSQVAHQQAQQRINGLSESLRAEQDKAAQLASRLATVEAVLSDYEGMNLAAVAESVASTERDLRRLEGEHTGHVYRTSKQFESNELIHANLEQSDADLRKHVATTVSNLERRSKQARGALRSELATRFEEDRSVVLSGFRELEMRVGTGSARAALAIQLLREFLLVERAAMAAREQRLEEVIGELDGQFRAEDAEARGRKATRLFGEARASHQAYLADEYQGEELNKAIVAYQEGLTLRPDACDMHYEVGKLLRTAGRQADAEPHLRYYLKNGTDAQRQDEVRGWLKGS